MYNTIIVYYIYFYSNFLKAILTYKYDVIISQLNDLLLFYG